MDIKDIDKCRSAYSGTICAPSLNSTGTRGHRNVDM